jgi:hypothetical protein
VYSESKPLSGFFLKKKPPLTELARAWGLENRSEQAAPFPVCRLFLNSSIQSPIFYQNWPRVPFQDVSAYDCSHLLQSWILFVHSSQILPDAR